MGLFSRKRKKPVDDKKATVVYTDYINWDKDLGFLTLLMTRKKNISKNYFINIYATQLKDTDYIRDEDIVQIIENGVKEVIDELSESYREFLTVKYFKDLQGLIKFITEDFYVDLTNSAIVQNSEKIRGAIVKKRVVDISKKNNSNKEEKE